LFCGVAIISEPNFDTVGEARVSYFPLDFGGSVLGKPIVRSAAPELLKVAGRALINGKEDGSGTGADVGRILPIPDVSNKKFPEAAKHEAAGLHRIMYRWSPEDYRELDKIWNGAHPEDGQDLVVEDEIPEGAPWPDFDEEPQLVSPGTVDPEMIEWYAEALTR
jgi:hypothetical protein